MSSANEITVSYFREDTLCDYQFRGRSDLASSINQNLKIKSYQLPKASLNDKAFKPELISSLRSDLNDTPEIIGFWYAPHWQDDTRVKRKIGATQASPDLMEQQIFDSMGITKHCTQILHWGEAKITASNLSAFLPEIGHYENGFIIAGDSEDWFRFRSLVLSQLSSDYKCRSTPYKSHFETVKLAVTRKTSILTVTDWFENDVYDLDVFMVNESAFLT